METILRNFGKRLRKLRKDANLTQEQLGHLSNLDRTYISSVERGERNISLNAIEQLAKALNIEIADFFTKESSNG